MPAKRREGAAQAQKRIDEYLDRLAEAAGHADRALPLKYYCMGLFLPIARKSVKSMAARLAPASVRAMHQSLHHVVAVARMVKKSEARMRQGIMDARHEGPQVAATT